MASSDQEFNLVVGGQVSPLFWIKIRDTVKIEHFVTFTSTIKSVRPHKNLKVLGRSVSSPRRKKVVKPYSTGKEVLTCTNFLFRKKE